MTKRFDIITETDARLLEIGDATFLLTKLAVGAVVACTLYRFSHLPLAEDLTGTEEARHELAAAVEAATGASAAGWQAPERLVAFIAYLPDNLSALFS